MKNILILIFLFCNIVLFAQEADLFTDTGSNISRDPRMDQMNFVPNEVLVKFKDNVQITSGSQLKSAGITNVDLVLRKYNTEKFEKLFPNETRLKSAKVVKDPQGRDMVIPSLHNIYKIVLPELKSTGNNSPTDIFQTIEELKALPEVEYAEPNYIYSVDELNPIGPELSASDIQNQQTSKNTNAGLVPNDPLYAQQWHIPAIKADLVWEQTTGDTTQVIAILDTGIDWNHPDLKNKIWRNPGEIDGNGMDDDGNGLIDDIRGWDYINNDNNPADDNSHGTHVAGIAAAESNNGIGIAGISWGAKIMPIKVFQSSGRGDASTISQGIIYATNKGATVINMSFGSYTRSMTMENALANAYATAILVAAAGNDGMDIGDCLGAPFFPAALSFVLGVQSPEASFSNTDCTGPTFSNSSELFNYEMKAPGTNVISTIPGGNYSIYQGTSMAAPMVTAAVSLYRKLIPNEEETNEFMWVKLIQATETYLDIAKALTIEPVPEVWFLNKVMVDDCATCDVDGRVDSGETIKLWFRARNTGGQVDSVYWKIQLAEFEDPTTCNIIKDQSYIGSISPYATRTSENDPMLIEISTNVAHDRDITFDLLSWYKAASDTLIQKIVLTIENGEELSGVMDTTLILSPNINWLVNNSFKIGENGLLVLKAGTKITLNRPIVNYGKILCLGNKDSVIVINGPYSFELGEVECYNTNFFQIFSNFEKICGSFTNCLFSDLNLGSYLFQGFGACGSLLFNSCKFINIKSNYYFTRFSTSTMDFNKTNFEYIISPSYMFYYGYINLKHCNFSNITSNMPMVDHQPFQKGGSIYYSNLIENNFTSNGNTMFLGAPEGTVYNITPQYWGTNNNGKIKNLIWDFWDNATLAQVFFDPKLLQPSDSAHAIVWKVLVNGKDAQDEKVEPVGIGKHRFDVYFNRPMDKTITPNVAFGVRYPFSSNAVNEDSSWSENGRIYTVYKTIKLTTGDGINRIRVSGAKEIDGWDWEIPVEDQRFEFVIDAASSASLEFQATPGLGKVALEWNHNDLADGLGYNMYRMEHINDSVLTQPILVNNSLITDTLYTDFSVVPNKKYYYYYKILRTNFVETDSSRVVSAIPFTASKGDANGNLSVDVTDIITIVAYLMNNNPQPFIFEAADINSDGSINILDIVNVVNLILHPSAPAQPMKSAGDAEITLVNDTIWVTTPVELAGLQFTLRGIEGNVESLKSLRAFEQVKAQQGDSLIFLAYSLSGKALAAGTTPILKINSEAWIESAVLSTSSGTGLNVTIQANATAIASPEKMTQLFELGQNYPNPFSESTIIPFALDQSVDEAILSIYDITGRVVKTWVLNQPDSGKHRVEWSATGNSGIYLYNLSVTKNGQRSITKARRMINNKVN